MKGDAEVIAMICFFGLGALLGSTITLDAVPPFFQSAMEAAATLVAAYLGASYAFKLQNKHVDSERETEKVRALNAAIFELSRVHNIFVALDRDFVSKHREEPDRHLLILPVSGGNLETRGFRFDELDFAFESKNPNLLGTLALLEMEINATFEVLKQRSQLHFDHVQPLVERIESQYGEIISFAELDRQLGTRHRETMKKLTDWMVEGIGAVLVGTQHHIHLLNQLGREMVPGRKVITMNASQRYAVPPKA